MSVQDLLLDKKELAKVLKISLSTVNRWQAAGKFELYRVGRQVRFHRGEVARFLKSVRVPAK